MGAPYSGATAHRHRELLAGARPILYGQFPFSLFAFLLKSFKVAEAYQMCSHLADDDDACSEPAEAGPALKVNGANWSYFFMSCLWLTRPREKAKRTRFAHKFTAIFNSLHFQRLPSVFFLSQATAGIHRCISKKNADRHCESLRQPLERESHNQNGRILPGTYFSRVQPADSLALASCRSACNSW